MESIIIIGDNGMLGNYIKKYFQLHTKMIVIGINRQIFDAFTDPITKLEQILKPNLNNRSIVFNAIGIIPSASNKYTLTPSEYIKINGKFPHELSSLCIKYGSKMIHPTTDCVYTGKIGLDQLNFSDSTSVESSYAISYSYNELDIHDDISIYGFTKSTGEPTNCTVIRTSIIGEEVNNKRSLIEWVKQNTNKEINGYTNHYWNGITCLQYAKLVEAIINNNIFWNGVRHIFSPTTVSKYQLVSMINDTYKLNIKINKYAFPENNNKSLSTIYKENSMFNIPELSQQIMELKEFSSQLFNDNINNIIPTDNSDNIIPKVLYLYWDGSQLSYLQYLTVVTFKEQNPTWSVVMYMSTPTHRFTEKTWNISEQKTLYTGKNYLDDLYKLDIDVRKINFDDIGFRNDIPEVIKSDYLRYWLLGNYGGMWSDMDVIYMKPVDELFNKNLLVFGDSTKIDTVICYFSDHYPIGLFMSKPNNPFFLHLQQSASSHLNINQYQSIGCTLVKDCFNNPADIKEKFPELNILVMSNSCYLPYAWNMIDDIFLYDISKNITDCTIGIHWFNGSSTSVKYENMIDNKTFPTTGSIYPFVKKYFDLL